MSLEQAIIVYVVAIAVILAALSWYLFKAIMNRRRRAQAKEAETAAPVASQVRARPSIDWTKIASQLRPGQLLTGEMWLKVLSAAFAALCLAVIVIVYVFPLGAAWSAAASFVAVVVIVAWFFVLLD